jgi:hypothetical protein
MVRQVLAIGLCGALGTGCASASGPRVAQGTPAPAINLTVLADYVQRIPAGSRVRVERSGGDVLRGTLMKASADAIVVQRNTRVPEAPVDVPLSDITRVTLDSGSSTGKSIAIGMAAGAAGTLGVFAILALIFAGG